MPHKQTATTKKTERNTNNKQTFKNAKKLRRRKRFASKRQTKLKIITKANAIKQIKKNKYKQEKCKRPGKQM